MKDLAARHTRLSAIPPQTPAGRRPAPALAPSLTRRLRLKLTPLHPLLALVPACPAQLLAYYNALALAAADAAV